MKLAGPLGTPLDLVQWKRASSRVEARTSGFLSISDRKVGNPFETNQGNRPPYRDQYGRRDSDEMVPGPSVFISSETGMSGYFFSRIKGAKYPFDLQDGTWDFS